MDTRITLLPMTEAYAPGAARLDQITFPGEAWSEEAFLREARTPTSFYVAAVLGEEVVGFAGMQQVLDEGYIKSFQVEEDGLQGMIHITLKYNAGKEKVISGLRRVSKPGLRIYTNCEDMPKVMKGLGIAIVSTSKGVMTDKQARKENVGGEVLAFVW